MAEMMQINRPMTPERLRQLQRDLFELGRPFFHMQLEILNRATPNLLICSDGKVETIYSAELAHDLAIAENAWRDERQRFLAEQGAGDTGKDSQ